MRYKITIILILVIILTGCEQVKSTEAGYAQVKSAEAGCEQIKSAEEMNSSISKEFKLVSKPELVKKIISYDRKDSEGNILDKYSYIIGFDKNNFYFSYSNDKYWIYAIGNENNREILPIYYTPISNDVFDNDVYNNNILIGTGYWGDEGLCHYELFLISPEGKKNTIYECVAYGYPTAKLVDHYAVINLVEKTEDQYTSKLLYIDLDIGQETTVETSKYIIENNLYSGAFIINEGGWKEGFCYEKVSMNKESMQDDLSGKSSIYYYSFKDKKSQKLVDYSRKVLYINGSNDCFITSDYILWSEENTGRIWIKENNKYTSFDIPGIVAGEDIRGSYRLTNNLVLVYNYDNYFIYDLQNKSYYKEKYEFGILDNPDEGKSLSIKAFDNQFAYIEPDQNQLIIHLFELQ